MPTTTDADAADTLAFSITGLPVWAAFDTTNGQLSGTPRDGDVGLSEDIEITVSDGKAEDSIGPFRIQVAARNAPPPPANKPPTIAGTPPTTVVAGAAYTFTPTAADGDGDKLSFSISNRPRWATFNTTSGQLSGTPTAANVGTTATVRISVSDGKATASLPAFSVQVTAPPNGAPSISGTPATSVQAGTAYSFQPTATDPNSDALTWTIQNKPPWATFSASTGKLSGTPAVANAGTVSDIRISVSDGKVSASLAAFALTVTTAPNRAPTITGTPSKTGTAGAPYSFTPSAADADQDALSFSIQNKPAWATFSIANGQLSGTPTASGTFSGIVIGVSDGKVSAALPAFTITVSAATVNSPPTISGSPATSVTAGSAYSFTPSAADSNGDTLTFSIANKPSWATFSTSTGKLSGTPGSTNVGITSNVVISVTDGKATVSLAAFAITVAPGAPAVTGSATVLWTPPTENTDGSALSNLAGYRIYYGTSSGSLNQVVSSIGSGLTSYTIDDLAAGTWYFAVRAYSSEGTESAASNTASKTIQ